MAFALPKFITLPPPPPPCICWNKKKKSAITTTILTIVAIIENILPAFDGACVVSFNPFSTAGFTVSTNDDTLLIVTL